MVYYLIFACITGWIISGEPFPILQTKVESFLFGFVLAPLIWIIVVFILIWFIIKTMFK
jgi:hypothetical protein